MGTSLVLKIKHTTISDEPCALWKLKCARHRRRCWNADDTICEQTTPINVVTPQNVKLTWYVSAKQ